MSQTPTVECPTCGAPVEWSAESKFRPFCSDRCKLIDLGAWASEEHKIPSPRCRGRTVQRRFRPASLILLIDDPGTHQGLGSSSFHGADK